MKQEDDYRWLWKDWRVIAVVCVLCVALGLWVLSLSSTSTVNIHTKQVASSQNAQSPMMGGAWWLMFVMIGVVVMVTVTSYSSHQTTRYIVGSIAAFFFAIFAWNNIKQAIDAAMQVNINPADPVQNQVSSGLTMVLPIMLILSPIIIIILVMKLFRRRW
jgi:hypothetical protein